MDPHTQSYTRTLTATPSHGHVEGLRDVWRRFQIVSGRLGMVYACGNTFPIELAKVIFEIFSTPKSQLLGFGGPDFRRGGGATHPHLYNVPTNIWLWNSHADLRGTSLPS